jgi:hypothetical protein
MCLNINDFKHYVCAVIHVSIILDESALKKSPGTAQEWSIICILKIFKFLQQQGDLVPHSQESTFIHFPLACSGHHHCFILSFDV